MSFNAETIVSNLDQVQTMELAGACLDVLPAENALQVIREQCAADEAFRDELIAELEELFDA